MPSFRLCKWVMEWSKNPFWSGDEDSSTTHVNWQPVSEMMAFMTNLSESLDCCFVWYMSHIKSQELSSCFFSSNDMMRPAHSRDIRHNNITLIVVLAVFMSRWLSARMLSISGLSACSYWIKFLGFSLSAVKKHDVRRDGRCVVRALLTSRRQGTPDARTCGLTICSLARRLRRVSRSTDLCFQ